MANNLPDLFGLAKEVNLKEYLENFYAVEFNATNFAECPFCGSSETKAFSYSPKKRIVKCFSCMPKAFGLIDFVMTIENIDNHKAAKKICTDMGLYSEDISLSKEDREKAAKANQKKRAELAKKRDEKRKIEAEKTKKNQATTKKRMGKDAPAFTSYLQTNENLREELKGSIRWSKKTDAWWFDYLGYDEFQKSFVIINQDRSTNKIYNIKHKQKWVYDHETKKYIVGERSKGKWISQVNSLTYPFPMQYFKEHKDERVVISFGEKDSLNLLSYDINTLTLGGISNSFEPFKELFRNKIVYIWADNQLVEYIAAMMRYKELEEVAKSVYIVSFLHIDKTLPEKYDISDFIFANNFKDSSEIFEKIEYSCFKLTNSFIEDVAAHFHEDEKLLKRLDAFRLSAKSKKFADIEKDIIKTAKPVKSEMDAEINAAESLLEQLSKDKMKDEFRDFLGTLFREDGDNFVEKLKIGLDKKARLFSQFRKHHEVDATIGFVNDARASGHEIATYRDAMYIWTGSHYERVQDKELKVFILQKWMRAAKVNMKQQTPDFVKKVVEGVFYRGVALERFKENQDYRIINFDNGTAYLYNSGKFVFRESHLKADAMTSMLPISYKADAVAPKWKRFLSEVLPDKTEQDALMEFIGYCFFNSHSFQKFLFLLGSGANGKSIVLNVIKKFFGKDITSNVDLQQLYSHELIGIENKYINIGSEINPKGLDKGQIENLKKLTAGEATMLNPKNATPYDISGGEIPKFIFSGNNKPQGNLDGGLFRRMLLLNFNRVISKDERIQALEDRFEDEMSGIFNLAMDGLKRLLKNGDFSTSENMERNLQEYKEEANPILAYFNENVIIDEECMVPRKFLYSHYKTWADERGHHAASDRTFFSKIRDISKKIENSQPSFFGTHHNLLGARPRFVNNIRVDTQGIEEFLEDKTVIKTEDINIDQKLKLCIKYATKEKQATFEQMNR
jgi:putative DNA primase/helicase